MLKNEWQTTGVTSGRWASPIFDVCAYNKGYEKGVDDAKRTAEIIATPIYTPKDSNEPKKLKAKWTDEGWCSNCKCDMPYFHDEWEIKEIKTQYCPNCGAEMENPESEGDDENI